jgi:hypothetical protein
MYPIFRVVNLRACVSCVICVNGGSGALLEPTKIAFASATFGTLAADSARLRGKLCGKTKSILVESVL